MVKPSVVTREDVGSDPIRRPIHHARVVELEDTTGLGPVALVRGGSSPSSGTILWEHSSMAEQLALNQQVPGSSPGAPTNLEPDQSRSLYSTRGSSNGRTADFESANLGSSPSPRTNQLRDRVLGNSSVS